MEFLLQCGARGSVFALVLLLALGTSPLSPVLAGEPAATEAAPTEEPQCGTPSIPMPLHMFEGAGGAFTTHSAYLVNPALPGNVFGYPSFGAIHVHLGYGKHLEVFSVTETLWDRLELGYGLNYLDMGDLREDIERSFGDTVKLDDSAVTMHNFNARVQAIQEGDFGIEWMPALTLGATYKVNATVEDLDDDLGGALGTLGIEDDKGWDFTVTATKILPFMPVPTAVSVTGRFTEAAHVGLLGFTGERDLVVEVNACALILDKLWLAAEYKQKPSSYKEVRGLLDDEDDWWTVDIAYMANDQLTVAVGYGHFGKLLNHRANKVFGIAVKFEF
jgi:hypothetical protein